MKQVEHLQVGFLPLDNASSCSHHLPTSLRFVVWVK